VSAFQGAKSHEKAEGSVQAGAIDGMAGTAAFLTDGVFLYRVVGVVGSGLDEMVELEDCYRLDVVRLSVSELRARRLRVVTPAAADG